MRLGLRRFKANPGLCEGGLSTTCLLQHCTGSGNEIAALVERKKTEDTVYRDYFISLSGLENLNVFHLHVQHPFLLLVCFALTAMAVAVLGPKRLRIEIIPNCTTGTNYR